MNSKFYSDLELIKKDDKQKEAYESNVNSVVIAGPGSGKTRVLTLKAIKLCSSDIYAPSGLACISYSREIVRELKKRLKEYDYKFNKYDFIGTIHGFSLVHILEPFAKLYPQYKIPLPIKIASKSLLEEIYYGVLHSLNITSKDVSLTDINKQRSLSVDGKSNVQLTYFNIEAANLYENKLKESGCVDFISIINTATLMLREQAYIRQTLEAKFSWLLIDEYQDLGKALHEMVLELAAQTSIKIFVVGDMNQSIYGFNGAYPDFLEELDNLDDFRSISLISNYRSNQDIINGSLDSLKLPPPGLNYEAKHRKNENAEFLFITCKSEMQEQFEVVAKKIIPKLIEKEVNYNEIGIILGSGEEVVGMATYLKESEIPFYIVKWSFQNTDIINWLQNCAQWCVDKSKQSFDEIFKFWQKLLEINNDSGSILDTIIQRTQFYDVICSSKNKLNVLEWLEYFICELKLTKIIENSERYPDENNNLDLLLREARIGNLVDVKLSRFANLGKPENEVTITTRHSSKGLEFEVVILLGMEEDRFPHTYQATKREIEEAHRICYVCVSRAKKECILVRSKKITINTKNGPWTKNYNASRFWTILSKKFGSEDNMIDSDKL